jgi:integrase/recombinase XerD
MPCHHKLESYLDAYIEAAGIAGRPQGTAVPRGDREKQKLGECRISRIDVWYMVRRRASDTAL